MPPSTNLTDLAPPDLVDAGWIADLGCKAAFGYPGVSIDPWLGAVQAVLPLQMSRHELCAAYMALGAARFGLHPTAVLGTSGPGAQLMLAAARSAHSDRVPVLFVTGGSGRSQQFQCSRHDGQAFAALGLPSLAVNTAPTAAECRHLRALLADGQPVHIRLDSQDDAGQAGPASHPLPAMPLPRAGDLLVAAHPQLGRKRAAWRAFAHARGLACASTLLARGVFDETDPAFCGVWRLDTELPAAWSAFATIHLLGALQAPSSAPVQGPHLHCISLSQLADWPLQIETPELTTQERRLASCEPPADTLSQAADAVFRAVWSALPQGLPLFVDAGELRRAACTLPLPGDPRQLILCEREAPMGFALSAALGAACAQPGQPVVALMGDGSFLMHATELSTAVQVRAPLVGIVHCNGVLAAPYQRASHSVLREQLRTPSFDGPALCLSLGAAGRTASIAELPAALMQALAQATQRPQLLFVS